MNRLKLTGVACALCLAATGTSSAQTFTTIHSFDYSDGYDPQGALLQGTDGNLYGTTVGGGDSASCYSGCGTVFKMALSGTFTRLYSFCSQANCADGAEPLAGVVEGDDGNLYGTTLLGGTNGFGTAFRITSAGTLTTLHSFCSLANCTDGASPNAGLVRGLDGNFYGTTYAGGTIGSGTVFRLTPAGALTTLWSFCLENNCTDGSRPVAGVIQATDGRLYGTTVEGGAYNEGIVFQLTLGGSFAAIYSFGDGENPIAGLVQAGNGDFYGTTPEGGAQNQGTVFEVTPSGTFTSLHSFCLASDCSDGKDPQVGLIQATDANLYGTTFSGGNPFDSGTIFRITPSGDLTTLYDFCSKGGCTDGANPSAPLVEDTNGNLYGTASIGGARNDGTIFGLALGFRPFVRTEPLAAAVGKPVEILGTNLTGATSVTFNGTAATFTVKSPSLITTTVPAGATTGLVQVVTPSETLTSNVPFRVIP